MMKKNRVERRAGKKKEKKEKKQKKKKQKKTDTIPQCSQDN
jgi:hypothetical protein